MDTLQAIFDDIDAMAASPIGWNQQYEQIGRGKFQGSVTQIVLNSVQIGRVTWSPGILQRGAPAEGAWVFGLPIAAAGSLHVRYRQIASGEIIAATSNDDIGFAATGETDLVVAVLPVPLIERWMQVRRNNTPLPKPHDARLSVTDAELRARALALLRILNQLMARKDELSAGDVIAAIEAQISDILLASLPSAEIVEPLHHRARIARNMLAILKESLEIPVGIGELCEKLGVGERTLFLSCAEAFGQSPARLLAELRLNAARRALSQPTPLTSVTRVAIQFGFMHFGRFAESYVRQFGELPSATLAEAGAWRGH